MLKKATKAVAIKKSEQSEQIAHKAAAVQTLRAAQAMAAAQAAAAAGPAAAVVHIAEIDHAAETNISARRDHAADLKVGSESVQERDVVRYAQELQRNAVTEAKMSEGEVEIAVDLGLAVGRSLTAASASRIPPSPRGNEESRTEAPIEVRLPNQVKSGKAAAAESARTLRKVLIAPRARPNLAQSARSGARRTVATKRRKASVVNHHTTMTASREVQIRKAGIRRTEAFQVQIGRAQVFKEQSERQVSVEEHREAVRSSQEAEGKIRV